MNILNNLENNRYGFATKWNYDTVIKRLKCLHDAKKRDNEVFGINRNLGVYSMTVPMSCKFSYNKGSENLLAVANEAGMVYIENVFQDDSVNDHVSLHEFQAHRNAIFDLDWCDVDNKMVIGSGDHFISYWDVNESSATKVLALTGHWRSVKSVCFCAREKHIFASGGRDGLIQLWDARTSKPSSEIKPFSTIKGCFAYHPERASDEYKVPMPADSVIALLYKDTYMLLSCTVGQAAIKVWDTRKYYSVHSRTPIPAYKIAHPDRNSTRSFVSLALDPTGTKLYATCLDQTIRCYNTNTYSPIPEACYSGHVVHSWYNKCCVSPDGRYLISGSSDNKALIWRTDQPGEPLVSLNGHTSEVTCVDWSRASNIRIATCSDEIPFNTSSRVVMVWGIGPEDDALLTKDKYNEFGVSCSGWAEEVPGFSKTVKSRKICKPLQDFEQLDEEARPNSIINSPTANLPNYAIDGTSPYHQCPPKPSSQKKDKSNWLLEHQRKTPPVQNGKTGVSPSSGAKRPRQRNSKACGNLLKFFKTADKQNCNSNRSCIKLNKVRNSTSLHTENSNC